MQAKYGGDAARLIAFDTRADPLPESQSLCAEAVRHANGSAANANPMATMRRRVRLTMTGLPRPSHTCQLRPYFHLAKR